MVNLYLKKEDCCGCTACEHICPKNAIKLELDEDGFTYPEIDVKLCVDCNLCKKVCSFQSIKQTGVNKNKNKKTYAAILKDKNTLKNSASGGAFVGIAKYILDNYNSVVVGCTMDTEIKAKHICIENSDEIIKLQGSKYVQSDLGEIFKKVKQNLDVRKTVLFTGTPCQVSGLKSFLGKEYDNLITIDLICHGVPSPVFFKSYISYISKKVNGNITNFKFRDKKNGWGLLAKVEYEKNGVVKHKTIYPIMSYYYYYFLKGYIYRPSCYECPYTSVNRVGDFTVGDYWGVGSIHPNLNEQEGVSLIIANNAKSIKLINDIKQYMNIIESDIEVAKLYNGQLNEPVTRSDKRELILDDFRKFGSNKINKRYYYENRVQIIKFNIKKFLPRCISRRIIKR